MDLDKITLNECANDGTKIYIYYSAETGMWSSFGYSAFALASLASKEGIDHIDSFSVQIQMPSVVINNTGFKKIESIYGTDKIENGQYLIEINSVNVDMEKYRQWTSDLRMQ